MEIPTILVPVDFSDCSIAAFQHALGLVPVFSSQLVLLHVVDVRHLERIAEFTGVPPQEIQEKVVRQAKKSLHDFAEKWRSADVHCVVQVAVGAPFQEIALKARKDKVDLIVMGGYGKGGKGGRLDELFFGSTAEKVIRLLPCPVLCVPQKL